MIIEEELKEKERGSVGVEKRARRPTLF